jgi:serpin B
MSATNIGRCLALAASLALPAAPGFCRAAENDIRALAKAYNGFGQDVFTVLERKPGNIVFSPYSLGVAMAMTLSGARGETQSEMLSAMRFTQTPSEIDDANRPLAEGLQSYGKQAPGKGESTPATPTELDIANALMITPLGELTNYVSPQYVSLLRKQYDAELFRNASLKEVNAWAARKTKGKIDPLLQKIPELVIALILNAVYFNGAWETPFDHAATRDAAFTLTSGDMVQTPTMAKVTYFNFYAGQGFRAVRVPYRAHEIGMIIVLPEDPTGLEKVSAKLDADGLSGFFEEMDNAKRAYVDLKLPRFKVNYGGSLVEAMKLAGVKLAFDDYQANFEGIAGRPLDPGEIYISEAIQLAAIDVTEEGTVAAAVTVDMPTIKSMPPPVTPFVVDHPFLFYIVDQKSGAVLFQGRIEDPRADSAK